MGGWQVFFWIMGAVIAFAGLIMALARTPPNDAITNLSKWAEWAGLHHLSGWLRDRRIIKLAGWWAQRTMIALVFIAIIGVIFNLLPASQPTPPSSLSIPLASQSPVSTVNPTTSTDRIMPLTLRDLHVEDTRFFEGACRQVDGRSCAFNTGGMVAATIYQCCPSGSRCTVPLNGVPYCKRLSAGETSTDRDRRHNFRGDITFENGSTETYIWLWNDMGGSKIAWARNPIDLNESTLNLTYVQFSDVARIDFEDTTRSEMETIAAARLIGKALKARITYHDGTVRDGVYLYAFNWTWEGYHGNGSINPKVRSMTIEAAE